MESECEEIRRKLTSKIESVESSRLTLSVRFANVQKELETSRNESDTKANEIKRLELHIKTLQDEQTTAANRMASMANKVASRMREEFKKEKDGLENQWYILTELSGRGKEMLIFH